jgi:hypothetical protein
VPASAALFADFINLSLTNLSTNRGGKSQERPQSAAGSQGGKAMPTVTTNFFLGAANGLLLGLLGWAIIGMTICRLTLS